MYLCQSLVTFTPHIPENSSIINLTRYRRKLVPIIMDKLDTSKLDSILSDLLHYFASSICESKTALTLGLDKP